MTPIYITDNQENGIDWGESRDEKEHILLLACLTDQYVSNKVNTLHDSLSNLLQHTIELVCLS